MEKWTNLPTNLSLLTAGVLLALAMGGPIWAYLPVIALMAVAGWRAARPEWGAWVMAAICLVMVPDLSDDYHRYLFEGHATLQGYSPYVHAPAELYDKVEHSSEGLVNNDGLTAIYPPLAQYAFALSAAIGQGVWTWKLLLAVIFGVFFWREPEARVWVLGPLLLVEGFWNGHLDALGLIPLYYMVRDAEAQRGARAGVMLALCVALKYLPILFFPFVWWHLQGKERWRFVGAMAVTGVLVFAPYLGNLPSLLTSFKAFAGNWHFNNPVFTGLTSLGLGEGVRPTMAGLMIAGLCVTAGVVKGLRCRLFTVWCVLLLMSPTVYPWYLLWLLPLVGARQAVNYVQLMFVAGSWSYWVLIDYRANDVWQESLWWLVPEWIVMIGAAWLAGLKCGIMEQVGGRHAT